MASTILEQTRAAQEEIERLEKTICKDLKSDAKGHKEVLMQNHRVSRMLDRICERSAKVRKIYQDEDGSRKDEIDALGSGNTFSLFYDRLKEVRDYHRRYPNLQITSHKEEEEELLSQQVKIEWSGEECHGKYLDLHSFYDEFQNSKFGTKLDYLTYMSCFLAFGSIKRETKMNSQYRDYLEKLLTYLTLFHERTKPLTPLPKLLGKVEEEFEVKWDSGQVLGWEDKGAGGGAGGGGGKGKIDLEPFNSTEELLTLGPEILKDGLAALGLKSGGSAKQRAERLWLTKGVEDLSKLDRKLFAPGHVPAAALSAKEVERRGKLAAGVALLECKCLRMGELLEGVAEATRGNVEKKATMTVEEMEAELAEQEGEDHEAEDADSDEEAAVYNPLKLPMGWDGKPIPYWLYKLHGLNQEFTCEICGNYSYWGRRAFERHFREARHQHGMKCLEIPNTKQFYEITKIDDAKALWANLVSRNEGGWEPDVSEEFEDADGNVYNKKTYADLKRQGLI